MKTTSAGNLRALCVLAAVGSFRVSGFSAMPPFRGSQSSFSYGVSPPQRGGGPSFDAGPPPGPPAGSSGPSGVTLASNEGYWLSTPERLSFDPKKKLADLGIETTSPEANLDLIQGAGTVRTYQMPLWTDRCQYILMTEGRPLKADVELWLGPLRTVHKLKLDIEDGFRTPYMGTLKFKKMGQVLKLFSNDSMEFPFYACVFVPTADRAKWLLDNTESVWNSCTPQQKQEIQGGSVTGGGGAIRYWTIPPEVEAIQILGWSIDTGKKSFRITLDVLQGPNNKKQTVFLQCGGGSQPYHGIIQTPGPGCVIIMKNLKFLEDGFVQIAIVPYEGENIFPWKKAIPAESM